MAPSPVCLSVSSPLSILYKDVCSLDSGPPGQYNHSDFFVSRSLTYPICEDPFSKQGRTHRGPLSGRGHIFVEADSRLAAMGLGPEVSKDTALGGPRLALMSCCHHLKTEDPSVSFALAPTNYAVGSGPGADRHRDTFTWNAAEVTLQTSRPLESVWLSHPYPIHPGQRL